MNHEDIKKHLELTAATGIDELLFPGIYGDQILTDEEQASFDAVWERMKEACKEYNFVVIGVNDLPIGLSASALAAYKEAERLRSQYEITIKAADNEMMKPAFLNESKSKLRTGKGHYKLKKGKKK